MPPAAINERTTYRPIESRLAAGSQPEDIGKAFVEQLGTTQVYLADLDAIEGAEPAWDLYVSLIQCGLSLWIDAGLSAPFDSRCEESARDPRRTERRLRGGGLR